MYKSVNLKEYSITKTVMYKHGKGNKNTDSITKNDKFIIKCHDSTQNMHGKHNTLYCLS